MTVHHMVLLRFKPEVDAAEIAEVFRQIARLPELIPGIQYYAGGTYSSPEGLDGGFTHGFLMMFPNAAARDAYLPHPDHERVKDMLLRQVAAAVAFDFEANPLS